MTQLVTKQNQTSLENRVTLAITGASGFAYGRRLLDCLLVADYQVFLLVSEAARAVALHENKLELEKTPTELGQQLNAEAYASGQLQICNDKEWGSPVASGSGSPASMVVCPCSGGTLSAIAQGASNNLIERAADVAIKENKQLIIVPREMPVSAIHLENMLKLARLGVTVMPASPGFYHSPKTVDDIIDFVVSRVLDQLGISQTLMPRWGVDE